MGDDLKLKDNHSYYRVNTDNTEIEYEDGEVRRYGKDATIVLNDEVAIKYGDSLTKLDDQQSEVDSEGKPKKRGLKDILHTGNVKDDNIVTK